MNEHLGHESGDPQGRNRGNSRDGKRAKTVITGNAGPVAIEVPRDREAGFEPVIVGKRRRRPTDLDQVVLSLPAKGLTTGKTSAHLSEVYGAEVPKNTVTRIADRVVEEMTTWWARPSEQVHAAIFNDAIMVHEVTPVRRTPFPVSRVAARSRWAEVAKPGVARVF